LFSQFNVVDSNGVALSLVKGVISRIIGGSSVTVASAFTDSSGFVNYFLNPDFSYGAVFSKSGYPDNSFSFTPTTDIRTVIMGGGITVTGNGTQIMSNMTYKIFPTNSSLNNNTDYTFGFNVTSSQTITLISMNITNSSGEQLLFISNAGTGFISGVINTGNYTRLIGKFLIQTDSEEISFSRLWTVGIEYIGDYSIFKQLNLYLDYGFKPIWQYLIILGVILIVVIFMSTNETLDTSESKIIVVFLLIWAFSFIGWLDTGIVVDSGSANTLGQLSSKYGIAILSSGIAVFMIFRRIFI